MMTLIKCDNCNESGLFKLTLNFEYEYKFCKECHHNEFSTWHYYFCNMICMTKWLNDNKKGFPCKNCKGTGFWCGYEVNGVCGTCKGDKIVHG